jgi:CheY-like chemotaxis protein
MSPSGTRKARRIALLGFGNFERSALVSYLRLSRSREPAFEETTSLGKADYLIADADHAGTVDAVLVADRVADTVFIGSLAPDGALAWMMRPIDPLQVFREIGATIALRQTQAQASQVAPRASGARSVPMTVVADTPAADLGPTSLSTASLDAPASDTSVSLDAPTAPAADAAPDLPTTPAVPTANAEPAALNATITSAPRAEERARAQKGRGRPRRADDVAEPVSALLVDDSEVGLHSLERQLQDLGLRTETAADSQHALELMARQHFDVIFLDVDLGQNSELDGLALCQRIKGQHRRSVAGDGPAVVMVSTHAATTDRVRGSFAGCDAYLSKPIDDDALRRSLRTLGMRFAAPVDSGFGSSRPGGLSGLPPPLDRS